MGRKVALLVATYEYADPGLRRLTSPAHDAEALAAVLEDPAIAGFEVTTLVNEPHHQVGAAISDLYRDRRRDDLTLLYFTGHGLKDDDGRLFLATTDTRRDSLLFTSLAAEQIDQAMTGCMSRQKVLILDCCYSGAFPEGFGAKGDTAVHTLGRFQGRGRTVLTASDATQYSFEGGRLTGGAAQSVFTRHLVAGLRDGSADLDGDGDITLDELYSYVHDRVVDEMPQQHPKRLDNVEGRIVIARNVNWALPAHLRHAMDSPISAERSAALDGLARLHRIGNSHVRGKVLSEIQRLVGDDNPAVSAAAADRLSALDPPVPTARRGPELEQQGPVGDGRPQSVAAGGLAAADDDGGGAGSSETPAHGTGRLTAAMRRAIAPARWTRRQRVVAMGVAAVVTALAALAAYVLPQFDGSSPKILNNAFMAMRSVAGVSMSTSSGPLTATGLVLDGSGDVLTTTDVFKHGVTGKLTVTITGVTYPATLLGRAESYDVAVIRPKDPLKQPAYPVKLGSSRSVAVKDRIVALRGGHSWSDAHSQGTVTAVNLPVAVPAGSGGESTYASALATDASFQPADAGGPVLDVQGRVVAMNATLSPGDGSTAGTPGSAFAIPIDQAVRVAGQLIGSGKASYPAIGLQFRQDDAGHGAEVAAGTQGTPSVVPDGPADRAGLRAGDVITAVDGSAVTSGADLIARIWLYRPADKVAVTYARGGQNHSASVVLGSRVGDSG